MSIFDLDEIWHKTIPKNWYCSFEYYYYTNIRIWSIKISMTQKWIHLRCTALNKISLSFHKLFRGCWSKFLQKVLQKCKCGWVWWFAFNWCQLRAFRCMAIRTYITSQLNLMSAMLLYLYLRIWKFWDEFFQSGIWQILHNITYRN